MTAVDALVAEALAVDGRDLSCRRCECDVGPDGSYCCCCATWRDKAEAALAHLATRAAEAEGRAERAEARAFWQMVCIAKARECIWRKMNARDAEGRGALHDEHDRLLAFAGVERGDWCAP